MIKFIERLLIKRRQKQYAFMIEHCKKYNRMLVVDLWSGKLYHTISMLEIPEYLDIWTKYNMKIVSRDCIVMVK